MTLAVAAMRMSSSARRPRTPSAARCWRLGPRERIDGKMTHVEERLEVTKLRLEWLAESNGRTIATETIEDTPGADRQLFVREQVGAGLRP